MSRASPTGRQPATIYNAQRAPLSGVNEQHTPSAEVEVSCDEEDL